VPRDSETAGGVVSRHDRDAHPGMGLQQRSLDWRCRIFRPHHTDRVQRISITGPPTRKFAAVERKADAKLRHRSSAVGNLLEASMPA